MNSVKRLYKQFRPSSYQIEIDPDTTTESFTGKVVITGYKIGPSSSRISFHQLGLRITQARITQIGKTDEKDLSISRINYHDKFNELRLHFDSKLKSGQYRIVLEFKGKITTELSGMYLSSYKIDGRSNKIITTQFESHSAREVFPCIDEPEAKATFSLAITHNSEDSVVSNSVIDNQNKISDTKTKTTFKLTPIMSTYLLAFVIGDLVFKEGKTSNGTVVRSYATKDKIGFVDFSLEVAIKCLDFYNEYFNIPYPLEKCDLIALPDFSAGAMENWGCVTFREQAMLVDPVRSSLSNKQFVATVVAHELAHQWFGNLVTMKWWTDLWLNEGFATWMEYFAIDNLFPDWNLWGQFVIDEQQIAMSLDALSDTHPIEVEIKHPDEIRIIFDSISYSKGASVIRMLHELVGPNNFKLGLQDYLKSFSYKNTTTEDLWSSLEKISAKPVSKFMSAWTSQKGFPIVECRYSDRQLIINQSTFSFENLEDQKQTIWPIALISNRSSLPEILSSGKKIFKGDFEGIQLNIGRTGFYRTVYDTATLNLLSKKIERLELAETDRLGLLSDLAEASRSGKTSITNIMDFMKYYANETSYVVWDIIASTIGSIRFTICDEQLRDNLRPYISNLIEKEVARLGFNPKKNEIHFDTLLRPVILGLACVSDDQKVIDFCHEQFNIILKNTNSNSVNPDFKSLILNTVAKFGGQTEYSQMVEMHNESNLSEERTTLISSICSFKDPILILKTLAFIKSENVRSQDVLHWVSYCFSNRYAKLETWEWLKKNWEWLEEILGTDFGFFRLPVFVARSFSDINFLSEYINFFKPKLNPSFERAYKQGIEIIKINSNWKISSFDKLNTYLERYNSTK